MLILSLWILASTSHPTRARKKPDQVATTASVPEAFFQVIKSSTKELKKENMYLNASKRKPRRRTKGWELLVLWKDGTMTWEPLKDLKESNPVQVAKYSVINQISEEPAFAWWVKDVLRHRDRIISKVKSRYWKKTHKYGIELPKDAKRTMEIDAETGTNF
jgi:hypothetical protein